MIQCFIDLVKSGWTGKYLALRQGARTSLRSVRTVRPDLEPPTQSIST